jgi:hypothetical protein
MRRDQFALTLPVLVPLAFLAILLAIMLLPETAADDRGRVALNRLGEATVAYGGGNVLPE